VEISKDEKTLGNGVELAQSAQGEELKIAIKSGRPFMT
jgi:hypothetical protein